MQRDLRPITKSGEMKHGPDQPRNLAIVTVEGLPVICLLDHHELSAKTVRSKMT